MARRAVRYASTGAALAVALTVAFSAVGPGVIAAAAESGPPGVDISRVPSDTPPGPEAPSRQTKACAGAGVLPGSDLTAPPPPAAAVQLDAAHRLSTGAGVTVAVIDTGVRAQPRLPNLVGGGDYVASGNGLGDCDAHGTLVAGIIGAAPSPADGFVGIAPDARLISIRQSSDAFSSDLPAGANPNDPNSSRTAGDLRSLARAVVHAANMGARVINISVMACLDSGSSVDQSALGAALWYAATVHDAVIVAAAGNTSSSGAGQDSSSCAQNPPDNPADQQDPRGWGRVKTLSSPGLFSTFVLSVGFTSPNGTPSPYSMRGPWLGIAAPGTAIVSLSPVGGDATVNGVQGQNNSEVPVAGSSYAAAYVSGTAALLRSKFPQLGAVQIIDRLTRTAHAPARGVDDTVGHGLLDPVAALTADIPLDGSAAGHFGNRALTLPPSPPAADPRPRIVAIATVLGVAVLVGAGLLAFPVIRRRRESQ